MQRVTVLVIEAAAAEAALACAALALRPGVRVLEAPDLGGALERLDAQPDPVALAIAGSAALSGGAEELVRRLGARGIPVIGVAPALPAAARERALQAGVREVHERPREWRPYSELIDSLLSRFIPAGLPPRRGPTS
jgi:hypothetical protein